MDAGYAAAYLSEELLEDFNMKIQWMEVREEEVVQKHVKLLSAVPVGAYYHSRILHHADTLRYGGKSGEEKGSVEIPEKRRHPYLQKTSPGYSGQKCKSAWMERKEYFCGDL